MKMYRTCDILDRDQVEDAELTAKEAAEPMPRNVQDFKDHPHYALERHLKRHEVIHPKREVGKVSAGRGHSATALEPIYRRRDVKNVQSADKWYRLGREIKVSAWSTLFQDLAKDSRQGNSLLNVFLPVDLETHHWIPKNKRLM